MNFFHSCLILVLVFLSCINLSGQSKLLAEADKHFDLEQFSLAAQYYQELADLDALSPKQYFRLAECYRRSFQYEDAEMYYLKTYNAEPRLHAEAFYYYALMLKLNGRFQESLAAFEQFISLYERDQNLGELVEQARIEKEGSEIASELNFMAGKIFTFDKPVNSTFNDYAPARLDSNHLMITSGRLTSNRKPIDERFGEGFSDNYFFTRANGLWKDESKNFVSALNTPYNDGSGSFNRERDKYYYTICGLERSHCRIFVSMLKGGKWTEGVPLNNNINLSTYDSKQPSISPGGDTLFFVSDRKGGHGKNDIWMSIDANDDDWGPPLNLGRKVNTKYNEISPCITSLPNVLFFASEGHKGYGGFDIYMAKRLSQGDTMLYNVDAPFNSNHDDCFANVNEDEVYWASNRKGGLGGFDIYAAKIKSLLSFVSLLSLKNQDASRHAALSPKKALLQDTQILAFSQEDALGYDQLSYDQKKIVDRMVDDQLQHIEPVIGSYPQLTRDEFSVLLSIARRKKEEYLWQLKMNRSYLLALTIPTPLLAASVEIEGGLFDSLTQQPIPGTKIILTDSLGVILKITHTNEQGRFRVTNSEPRKRMVLRLEDIPQTGVKPYVKEIHYRRTDGVAQTYGENIYFDFDRYAIRPEASVVLNELADLLIKSPGTQLEIYAYADDIGSTAYNHVLSNKRGMSVLQYLISKGVDETGVSVVAMGKQNISQGGNEALERQFNRRVEFYLTGAPDAAETRRWQTCITKRKTTWDTIFRLTGLNNATLSKANQFKENTLKAFQPVRLPMPLQPNYDELFFIPKH